MRGESHKKLGEYLSRQYLNQVPQRYIHAFMIGCIEPDRNPFTYLKGSLRHSWLRGHNYRNARRFLRKLSHRLEHRNRWNLWDYYSLGKLIHYTADAFTLAHNEMFPLGLEEHREYEVQLQEQFLNYLKEDPQVDIRFAGSIMHTIYKYHEEYCMEPADFAIDMKYTLSVCCCILALVFMHRII